MAQKQRNSKFNSVNIFNDRTSLDQSVKLVS